MKSKSALHKLYFWSDPHFGHASVIRFCNRPYSDVYDMNEELINNYNSVVPKDGVCIWVGDCFFMNKPDARLIMDRLNGIKILVRGNHDFKPSVMYGIGFSYVCEYTEIIMANETVKIKHFPHKYSSNKIYNWIKFNLLGNFMRKYFGIYKPRHFDKFPEKDGNWIIHGHTHSKDKVNLEHKTIHVGVDAWGYQPVSYKEIEKIIIQEKIKDSQEKNR